MNCPHCGAVVKEGKFCNYCGAKLPNDTKRVEVKIDQRIEDVAEVKRADYEAKESALRVKKMQREITIKRVKWITVSSLLLLSVILGIAVAPSLGICLAIVVIAVLFFSAVLK